MILDGITGFVLSPHYWYYAAVVAAVLFVSLAVFNDKPFEPRDTYYATVVATVLGALWPIALAFAALHEGARWLWWLARIGKQRRTGR